MWSNISETKPNTFYPIKNGFVYNFNISTTVDDYYYCETDTIKEKTFEECLKVRNTDNLSELEYQELVDDINADLGLIPRKTKLEILINRKLDELDKYDKSENVNIFYVNNIPMWYDKYDRVSLRVSIEKWKEEGKETIKLWNDYGCFELPCDTALNILNQIETYAFECYNTTMIHRQNIKNIQDEYSVDWYDFKKGYPDKLKFEL